MNHGKGNFGFLQKPIQDFILISNNYFFRNHRNIQIILSFTLIISVALLQDATAQKHFKDKTGRISPWEIELSGGFSSFMTSVNPDADANNKQINYWHNDFNPGIGLSVVRNISPSLGIEINWLNTRLTGTWDNQFPPLAIAVGYPAPLTYNSKINQFDLMMAFNLNKIYKPGNDEDKWHIYLKPGIGIAHIKDNQNFFPGDSPYLRVSAVLDAGISVSLSEKIKIMAGSSFRFVNTDNLDGVHVLTTDSEGNPVGQEKVYEYYNYTYLRVSYSFGRFGSRKSNCSFGNKRVKTRIYKRY